MIRPSIYITTRIIYLILVFIMCETCLWITYKFRPNPLIKVNDKILKYDLKKNYEYKDFRTNPDGFQVPYSPTAPLSKETSPPIKRIVCIGNSVTQGNYETKTWPYYLQTYLHRVHT